MADNIKRILIDGKFIVIEPYKRKKVHKINCNCGYSVSYITLREGVPIHCPICKKRVFGEIFKINNKNQYETY